MAQWPPLPTLVHTSYFILVQWKNTTQVYNSGVTEGGYKGANLSPDK